MYICGLRFFYLKVYISIARVLSDVMNSFHVHSCCCLVLIYLSIYIYKNIINRPFLFPGKNSSYCFADETAFCLFFWTFSINFCKPLHILTHRIGRSSV